MYLCSSQLLEYVWNINTTFTYIVNTWSVRQCQWTLRGEINSRPRLLARIVAFSSRARNGIKIIYAAFTLTIMLINLPRPESSCRVINTRSCIRGASVIPRHIIGTYSYRSERSATDRYCVTASRGGGGRGWKKAACLTRVQMTETRERRTARAVVANIIIRRDNAGRREREATVIIIESMAVSPNENLRSISRAEPNKLRERPIEGERQSRSTSRDTRAR